MSKLVTQTTTAPTTTVPTTVMSVSSTSAEVVTDGRDYKFGSKMKDSFNEPTDEGIEDDDDVDDEIDSASESKNVPVRSIPIQEEVIRYNPNITDDDYEEEEENDDHDVKELDDKEPKPQKRSHDMEQLGKTNNDIITEEEYKSGSLFEYKTSQDVTDSGIESINAAKTRGKVCIVKGRELICHDAESITEPTTTTTTTTEIPIKKTLEDKSSKEVEASHQCDNKEHVWKFKIEIQISERVFQQIEKTIRLLAYYVNFSIRLWNKHWFFCESLFFDQLCFPDLCNCK